MERRQIADVLVLHGLGIEPSMRQFRDRLVVQKAIYLCQEAGINLGYHFGWYLRGPYCSTLSDDMFGAVADPNGMDAALDRWRLDRSWQGPLRRVRSLIGELDDELARRLELLASVHFLVSRRQVRDADAKVITERLKKFGKSYTRSQVEIALGALKDNDLVPETR